MPPPLRYQTPSSYVGKQRLEFSPWGVPEVMNPVPLTKSEQARVNKLTQGMYGSNPLGNFLGVSPSAVARKRLASVARAVPAPKRNGSRTGVGAKSMQDWTIEQFADMLGKRQQTALDSLLEDSRRRSLAEQGALGGFGHALQGYAANLWNQTAAGYQQAAAAQSDAAAGFGAQVGQGLAEARAQNATLAAALGQTGPTTITDPAAAQAQVASEGGAKTGETMAAVGTAWGGYGATRPDTIGFMTGEHQKQVVREQIEADRDLKSKFLELQMDNPKDALDMWTAIQENKRQNVSTNIARQTLKTNIAMQRAKLRQSYAEMRSRAKTQAEKIALDRAELRQNALLDQQDLMIDQQTADARTKSAEASMTRAGASVVSAEASAARARTAEWKAKHPAPTGAAAKYSGGDYQAKVASAMYNAPQLFSQSGGDRAGYAFRVLWPQMARYVSPGSKKAARDLLMARLRKAAKVYKPKPSSRSGGSDESW